VAATSVLGRGPVPFWLPGKRYWCHLARLRSHLLRDRQGIAEGAPLRGGVRIRRVQLGGTALRTVWQSGAPEEVRAAGHRQSSRLRENASEKGGEVGPSRRIRSSEQLSRVTFHLRKDDMLLPTFVAHPLGFRGDGILVHRFPNQHRRRAVV